MNAKKVILQVVATVIFALAFVGIEYAQPYLFSITQSMVPYYLCEVLIYLCILGGYSVGVIPGLVLCAVPPAVMLVSGDAAVAPALMMAIANILAVLSLVVCKDKKLLGLGVGALLRFGFAYVSIRLVLAGMVGGEQNLGFEVLDKVNLHMLWTSFVGAGIFYLLDLLMKGTRKNKVTAAGETRDDSPTVSETNADLD